MKILTALIMFLISDAALSADISGHWEGRCVLKDFSLSFSVDILNKDNSYSAFFGSDEQRAMNIPLQNFRFINDSVHFELKGDEVSWIFDGLKQRKKINGIITKNDQQAVFELHKTKSPPLKNKKTEVNFINGDVILSGTLRIPKGKGPFTAIIFTHGSGSEGRFASQYLADYFSKNGFATLIYDKRGAGKSTGSWQTSGFDDLAGDCISGIKLLEQTPKINSERVGVYGHSQGGNLCPLILSMYPKTAFCISAAGGGVIMVESDMYGIRNRFSGSVSDSVLNIVTYLIKLQADYALSDDINKPVIWNKIISEDSLYTNEKWYQDYAAPADSSAWWYKFYHNIGNYNPVDYWQKVSQPVLLLKGGKDLVTPGYPSFQNIEDALKKGGNNKYKIEIFPNADHAFHVYAADDSFWFKATPGYCETILSWLKNTIK